MIIYLVLYVIDTLARRIDEEIDRYIDTQSDRRIIIYLVLHIVDTLIRRIDKEIYRL